MAETTRNVMASCLLCAGDTEPRFHVRYRAGTADLMFSVLRCRRCGLHSLSPRPAPQTISSFYPPDYEPFRALRKVRPNAWERWLHHRHWQLRCRAVQRFKERGKLLDVGCGTGEFLDALRQCGDWQVAGVEVHQRAAAYAQQAHGLTVHVGDISTLHLPSQAFDVVTMWDVIEHVPNPLETLRIVQRALKPDGVLLVSTPNAHAWQVGLWGKWWPGWDVPRHLQVFTLETLGRLFARTGFRAVKRLSFPAERYYLVEGSRMRLESLLCPQVTGLHVRPPPGRGQRLIDVIGVLLWPVLRVLDFTDRASQIAVAARPNRLAYRERRQTHANGLDSSA